MSLQFSMSSTISQETSSEALSSPDCSKLSARRFFSQQETGPATLLPEPLPTDLRAAVAALLCDCLSGWREADLLLLMRALDKRGERLREFLSEQLLAELEPDASILTPELRREIRPQRLSIPSGMTWTEPVELMRYVPLDEDE